MKLPALSSSPRAKPTHTVDRMPTRSAAARLASYRCWKDCSAPRAATVRIAVSASDATPPARPYASWMRAVERASTRLEEAFASVLG